MSLGGDGRGRAGGSGQVFLPIFFLEEDRGGFVSPGVARAFCQKELEFTGALLSSCLPISRSPQSHHKHRDSRPGSGDNSAFRTAAAASPGGASQLLTGAGWEQRGAPRSSASPPPRPLRPSSAPSSLPPAWHPPLSLRSSIYLSLNTMQLRTFA